MAKPTLQAKLAEGNVVVAPEGMRKDDQALLQLCRRLDRQCVCVCGCAFVGELCAPLQDPDTSWNNVRVPNSHAWTSGKKFVRLRQGLAIWFVLFLLQFPECMTGLSCFGGRILK